jgi:flagellar biogenesis protein FliO
MDALAIAALVLAALQDPAAGPPSAPPDPSAAATVALPPFPEAAAPTPEPEPARAAARIPPPEPPKAPSRKLSDGPEPGPGIGGFVLWSVVVMALMAGTFVLLRRLARGSRFLAGGGAINVLARKPLGQKQEVFLVEVGPKVFLVGSTRDRLSTLGEFAGPDDVASLRASLAGGKGADFRASLRAGLEGGEAAEPVASESAAYASIAEEIAGIRSMVRAWRV